MKSAVGMIGCLCAALFSCIASAQVYRLAEVPGNLPATIERQLSDTHASLATELGSLQTAAAQFNVECASVPSDSPEVQRCASREGELESRRTTFNRRAERYDLEVKRAEGMPPHSVFVWSVDGDVMLTRGHEELAADGQALRIGDCIAAGAGGSAELILPPKATLLVLTALSRFCYEPKNPATLIGVLGYLYRSRNGQQQVEEVVGVRG